MALRELGILSLLSDILAYRGAGTNGTCAARLCYGGNSWLSCENDALIELPHPDPAILHFIVHESDPSQQWKSWEQRLQLTSFLKRPSS